MSSERQKRTDVVEKGILAKLKNALDEHPVLFVAVLFTTFFSLGYGVAHKYYLPLKIEEERRPLLEKIQQLESEGTAGDKTSSDSLAAKFEYQEAVRDATARILVLQTWLPERATEAGYISESDAIEKRVLLASFRDDSHIQSRVSGRLDLGPPENRVGRAKDNVEECVDVFRRHNKRAEQDTELRWVDYKFNYGHHPGWIAVIDKQVFWGPTPVHEDNHTEPWYFHKAPRSSQWGRFWEDQFDQLWKGFSHDEETECRFNETLCP